MMISNKIVFILIGPKGSGKSHVGTIVEKYFGIPFLNVDTLGLENIPKSKLLGEDLIEEGFHFEEAKIAEILQTEDSVVFENTGSHAYFFVVLDRLIKKRYGRLFSMCFRKRMSTFNAQ